MFWEISAIGLWGKSMGANTALMFMKENPKDVQCVVLDSGFASLRQVLQISDAMAEKMGQPPEFSEIFLKGVDEELFKQVGFHIDDLSPEEAARECSTAPALFLYGVDEDPEASSQSKQTFNAYACKNKVLRTCSGDSKSSRPQGIITEILGFFQEHLLESATAAGGGDAAAVKKVSKAFAKFKLDDFAYDDEYERKNAGLDGGKKKAVVAGEGAAKGFEGGGEEETTVTVAASGETPLCALKPEEEEVSESDKTITEIWKMDQQVEKTGTINPKKETSPKAEEETEIDNTAFIE